MPPAKHRPSAGRKLDLSIRHMHLGSTCKSIHSLQMREPSAQPKRISSGPIHILFKVRFPALPAAHPGTLLALAQPLGRRWHPAGPKRGRSTLRMRLESISKHPSLQMQEPWVLFKVQLLLRTHTSPQGKPRCSGISPGAMLSPYGPKSMETLTPLTSATQEAQKHVQSTSHTRRASMSRAALAILSSVKYAREVRTKCCLA